MTQSPRYTDVDIELKDEYTPLANLFVTVTGCLPERKYNKYDVTKWLEVLRTLPGHKYTIMSFYYGVGCTRRTIQQIADFHHLDPAEVEQNIKVSIATLRDPKYRYTIIRSFGGPEHFTCS